MQLENAIEPLHLKFKTNGAKTIRRALIDYFAPYRQKNHRKEGTVDGSGFMDLFVRRNMRYEKQHSNKDEDFQFDIAPPNEERLEYKVNQLVYDNGYYYVTLKKRHLLNIGLVADTQFKIFA